MNEPKEGHNVIQLLLELCVVHNFKIFYTAVLTYFQLD